MGQRAYRTIVGLVALLGAAACGPDAPAQGPTSDPSERMATPNAPRVRAAAESKDALPAAEVERLVAAWTAAEDDGPARRAIEDALVAGGGAALDRLVAGLGDEYEARRNALIALVPLFGDAAVDRLLVVLQGSDRAGREAALDLLHASPRSSFDGARGEAVCRALLHLVLQGDEDESARALGLLGVTGSSAGCVAADLARFWCDAPWSPQSQAAMVLTSLGADAAPAAPVLAAWLRTTAAEPEPATEELQSERAARIEDVFPVLESIGASAPSILGDLRAVLASGPTELQRRVAWLLHRWGDAAAPAAPELIAMLRSPDEDVRSLAARVLAGVPGAHEAARGPLIEALTSPDESRRIEWSMFFHGFVYDPAFAARLAEIAPSLPDESLREVCETLASCEGIDTRALVAALVARPDPVSRGGALDLWTGGAADDAVPPAEILALLGDGNASVRIRAALRLAGRPGVDAARVRDVAVAELATRGDSWYAALDLVGRLALTDAKAFEALVASLDDPQACLAALAKLPPGDTRIPGKHPVAIDAAVPQAFDAGYLSSTVPALLRLDGGADAVVTAVQTRLAAFDSKTGQDQNVEIRELTPVISLLGPRAAAVRPALARIHRGLAPGPYEDHNRRALDRAIAEIDGDLEAIALTAWADRTIVERFLAAGDAGSRALVLYAGRLSLADESFAELFHDARADDAILAAATARASTDPLAGALRTGAATLAPLLPVERACALLRTLTKDDAVEVRRAVVDAWARVRASHPDVLTAADVAPLLADADGGVQHDAIPLAAALGPRGTDLVPALRAIRDERPNSDWVKSVLALWRITKDPQETLPALRAWMQRPSRPQIESYFLSPDSATAFAEMPFTVADIPAIVRVVVDGSISLESFEPLLARFGADAAPAVPVVRRLLHTLPAGDYHMGELMVEPGWIDTEGRAAARVLVAIGPAARVAIPDLRWRIAEIGDAHGVLSDAIRKLEASGR